MPYTLPQHDPDSAARKAALNVAQKAYIFDYQKFVAIADELRYPMVQTVQERDNSLAKQEWALDVVSTLMQIQANQAIYDTQVERGSICKLVWYVRLYKLVTSPEQRGLVEKAYKFLLSLFQRFFKRPKSEDIVRDVQKGDFEKIDRRIIGMLNDTQKQANRINERPPQLTTPANNGQATARSAQPGVLRREPLRDYKDLFQILDLPEIERHVQEDRAFSKQRVAGANPLMLERISVLPSNFPLAPEQYQSAMGSQDDLQRAMAEGRLYLADYKILAEITPGAIKTGPPDKRSKYLCHPIALFAMESDQCANRKLRPVAIQCHQTPSPENPIFTPPTLEDHEGKRWGWRIAKLMVQIADGNYHELISHLGRTHLLIEPIVIATHRQLPPQHPLFALLTPHFEGTLFINDFAIRGLINPGGTVEQVMAGTLASSLALSVKGAREYPFAFNQSFLPDVLQRRGLDNPALLPDYPYRDDAMPLWDAIAQWVGSYVRLFYEQEADVQGDFELQNWLTEIIEKGGISDIGEITPDDKTPKMRSIDYLIKMVTHIIFTGSVQHAAVNFPQAALMTFMPNMPLAAYREAPTSIDNVSFDDLLATLPSLSQSDVQMDMTYLLGSVYYTQLGDYPAEYFQDERIGDALKEFRGRLRAIELEIDARNEDRPSFYDTLKPSKIPQSINI